MCIRVSLAVGGTGEDDVTLRWGGATGRFTHRTGP